MISDMGSATDRLLVVGGTGFIGTWVAQGGLKRGYQVTALGRDRPLPERRLVGVEYLAADLRDHQSLATILGGKRYTHVVNLGGYIDHSLFSNGGREVIDAHFAGLMNVVKCLDWSILRGFVQIGSSDEYGGGSAPQNEQQREEPISCYSMAKLAANQFLRMLHRTEGFPATFIRLFLVYGPGQEPRRFLPQIITGCLDDCTFPTSYGDQLRDFCYVEDVVSGVFLALESQDANGGLFNIASGRPISIRSMIERIVALIGQGRPEFGAVPYRPGESMALYADVEKAHHQLGWTPITSLDEGLMRTISAYREQRNGVPGL